MQALTKKRYTWLSIGACTVVSAGTLYLSTGLGSIWQLAWIALIPLLWLAYSRLPLIGIVIATFVTFMVGNLGFLRPFEGMHAATLGILMAILGLAVAATIIVSFVRFIYQRNLWWLTLLTFPAMWTSIEYLSSLISPNGTIGSLAYTQAAVPVLIQSVSVFGIWSVTFLICLVANGVSLALRNRPKAAPIIGVIAMVFAVNLIFGILHLHGNYSQTIQVAAIVKDQPAQHFRSTQQAWLAITTAYAKETRDVMLANRGVSTIVLPEKLATLDAKWRAAVLYPLVQSAQDNHVRIVAGFEDDTSGTTGQNIAIVFNPDGTSMTYAKRQLLGPESNLTPGNKAVLLDRGKTAIEICKDMDFPQMIRSDTQDEYTGLALVPAEDFSVDTFDLLHARIAAVRGVEDGFSVVRTARKGDITMSDSQGRMLAQAHSSENQFTIRIASIPVGQGNTLYDKIGDVFAWVCLVWSAATLVYMLAKFLRI